MGWADCGKDSRGRNIGYAFAATCDEPGCNASIDRGLAYVCGEMHGEGTYSCERYFCEAHLFMPDVSDAEMDRLADEGHLGDGWCRRCCIAYEEAHGFVCHCGDLMANHRGASHDHMAIEMVRGEPPEPQNELESSWAPSPWAFFLWLACVIVGLVALALAHNKGVIGD